MHAYVSRDGLYLNMASHPPIPRWRSTSISYSWMWPETRNTAWMPRCLGRWCTGDAEGHVCHSEGGFGWDIYTGWLFGTCFIFYNIWDNPSHWLIFFKMVKTTNQHSWNLRKPVPGGVSSGNAGNLGFRSCTYKTTRGKARKMVGESYGCVSWDSGKKPTANRLDDILWPPSLLFDGSLSEGMPHGWTNPARFRSTSRASFSPDWHIFARGLKPGTNAFPFCFSWGSHACIYSISIIDGNLFLWLDRFKVLCLLRPLYKQTFPPKKTRQKHRLPFNCRCSLFPCSENTCFVPTIFCFSCGFLFGFSRNSAEWMQPGEGASGHQGLHGAWDALCPGDARVARPRSRANEIFGWRYWDTVKSEKPVENGGKHAIIYRVSTIHIIHGDAGFLP